MRIIVRAFFDGSQWVGLDDRPRRLGEVDVILEDRPQLGELADGRLAELIDLDSFEARRKRAADSFGGEAWLAVGQRAPARR